MHTVIARVWLPDRPGALGAVASRVGAVGGDVVGIEILERHAGQAVDELVIELSDGAPDDALFALLVAEIEQVDGVAVEELRHGAPGEHDPRSEGLEAAQRLVEAPHAGALAESLVETVSSILRAEWVALACAGRPQLVAEIADPDPRWVHAFLAGAPRPPDGGAPAGLADVAWASLGSTGLTVLAGRSAPPIRVRERRALGGLASIAATRWSELDAGNRLRHRAGAF